MKKILIVFLALLAITGGAFLYMQKYSAQTEEELGDTKINGNDTDTETETSLDAYSCNQSQMFAPPEDEGDLTEITLYIASSEDGVTFGDPEIFVEGAGVPSVTTGEDGTLVAVFNWFTDYEENPECYNKVAIKTSKDGGETWEGPYGLYVEDFPEDYQLPFDPTITTTEDGGYRLFFTTHVLGLEAPLIYGTAVSEDGLHYTWDGVAFSSDDYDIVDGAEVRVGDNWYMVAPMAKQDGKALDAVSSDGQTFTQSSSDRTGIYWVGNMVNVSGKIRFYGSCTEVANSLCYSSTQDGENWEEPVVTNVAGGDPGIAYTNDGLFLLIYAEPKDQLGMPEDSTRDKR